MQVKSTIDLSDLLTLMFVYFRLNGTIDWAWYYLAAPAIIAIVMAVLSDQLEKVNRRRRGEKSPLGKLKIKGEGNEDPENPVAE